MVLVVETGEGLPDSNSYATVEEGDAYHAQHLYALPWTNASPENRAIALQMATHVLEAAVLWNGQRKTDTQALGWPRNYAPQPGTRMATMTLASLWPHRFWAWWPNDSIPVELKNATIEMARELLKKDRTDLDTEKRGVKSVGLGQGAIQISLDATDRKELLTDMVRLMLKPFGLVLLPKSSSVPVLIG